MAYGPAARPAQGFIAMGAIHLTCQCASRDSVEWLPQGTTLMTRRVSVHGIGRLTDATDAARTRHLGCIRTTVIDKRLWPLPLQRLQEMKAATAERTRSERERRERRRAEKEWAKLNEQCASLSQGELCLIDGLNTEPNRRASNQLCNADFCQHRYVTAMRANLRGGAFECCKPMSSVIIAQQCHARRLCFAWHLPQSTHGTAGIDLRMCSSTGLPGHRACRRRATTAPPPRRNRRRSRMSLPCRRRHQEHGLLSRRRRHRRLPLGEHRRQQQDRHLRRRRRRQVCTSPAA